MLRLALILACLALPLEAKTNTQLCQAIKNDNHALVRALMNRGSDSFEEKYIKLRCFNKTLLVYAEKSPKTREYLIRTMSYNLIAREAKYD